MSNILLDMMGMGGVPQSPYTPGINPGAEDHRPQPQSRLDQFIGTPGGSFLMNILAQSGYSTTPQSPFGAIGRAALLSQQQGRQSKQDDLKKRLTDAQIKLLGARASEGGMTPAGLREFRGMTEGLSDEDREKARRIDLGLDPRAGMSAQERIALDNRLGDAVTRQEANTAGASEAAKQQAQIDAIIERKTTESRAVALGEVPERVAADQIFLNEGKEHIRRLKSGELETGPIRGQVPAYTTNEQLFEAYSGAQILEQISSVTFGALSKGEMDFLKTTVSGRTKTEEANIDIIQRKIDIIETAHARALKKLGLSPADIGLGADGGASSDSFEDQWANAKSGDVLLAPDGTRRRKP